MPLASSSSIQHAIRACIASLFQATGVALMEFKRSPPSSMPHNAAMKVHFQVQLQDNTQLLSKSLKEMILSC